MNGYVYGTTEDSGKFNHLYLLKFDCETLDCVAYKELPYEYQENGAPWCVADKDNNVIYTARRDHISQLNVFDSDTLEFKGTWDFNGELHKVQGGDIYQGVLYLTINRDGQTVFAVNLESGESGIAFKRNLNEGSEGEDITILPMSDGSLFHTLDIGKPRVGVHLRHYAFDPTSIQWTTE